MKRIAFVIIALALAGAVLATDGRAGAPSGPVPFVVVDPNDLRKPIPDPEQGLTEKYDDKVVRFSGAVRRWTLDGKAKKYTYEMHFDIIKVVVAKGKKSQAVREDTIIVPVTFREDDPRLRAKKPGYPLTVQGRGTVLVDGTLMITDAIVVPFPGPAPGVQPRPVPKK